MPHESQLLALELVAAVVFATTGFPQSSQNFAFGFAARPQAEQNILAEDDDGDDDDEYVDGAGFEEYDDGAGFDEYEGPDSRTCVFVTFFGVLSIFLVSVCVSIFLEPSGIMVVVVTLRSSTTVSLPRSWSNKGFFRHVFVSVVCRIVRPHP